MTAPAPRNHPAEDAHPAPTPAPVAVPEGGWRAQGAEERGQGICRTCAEPIWNEGGTVGHRKREEGWSDRIERGGDSLVCFKAVEYRHVPLAGREAYIYDLALDRGHRAAEADFAADPVKAVPDPCPTCGRDRYDTPFGPHAEGYGFCPESFHFRPRPELVVAPLPSEALRRLAERGVGTDLNPTVSPSVDVGWWYEYLRSLDRRWREEVARIADRLVSEDDEDTVRVPREAVEAFMTDYAKAPSTDEATEAAHALFLRLGGHR